MNPVAITLLCVSSTGLASAQVTVRVSLESGGAQSDAGADLPTPPGEVLSADGRYVVFFSSGELVPGDTNAAWDVFVFDRLTHATERVSVDSSGNQGNSTSGLYGIALSADGRFVAFESIASNLVPGDTNGREVFLRDRLNGTTERIALDPLGGQANEQSLRPSLSVDVRFVAFESSASNLVSGDTNGVRDVFVRDRLSGTTERVSVAAGGWEANGDSYTARISADGRYVAFESTASNLVTGDTNAREDVFVHDRQTSATELISCSSGGALGNGHSAWPCISADGRFVGFTSDASNFASGDTNNARDVFVRDRLSGTTTLVSLSLSGVPGNHPSQEIWLTADGGLAAFKSTATDLIPGSPTVYAPRIFVRDLQTGTTELVSRATDGSIPNGGSCDVPCLTPDGRYVAFRSNATSLVPGDTNDRFDVFVRDRLASGFTSLCDPGLEGVIPCPCGNPPSTPGRGCDNSSFTGGAALSAGGNAYLSVDSLVFTTQFETPVATSILLQGDASLPGGTSFGQGVRCVGGLMRRLYVKTAAAGSITAPDFAAGDPTISFRSSLLGVPIQPGQPYYYMVYYRDPLVLGGCPAPSTFSCTQTASTSWWP
jgi:Tol biopolymer transport system component